MRLLAFYSTLFLLIFLWFLEAPKVLAQANEVRINEFAAVTAGKSPDLDWVELYNESGKIISLNGWLLRDSTETNKVSLSGCIPAKKFRRFDFSNRLNNSGDNIRLFDKSSNLIDEISYFSDQVPSHQKGESTGRSPDASENWQTFTAPSPTNSACTDPTTKTVSKTLKISLSEIFPNPEKGGREWVEVYNPNSSKASLTDWQLVDAANHKKTLSGTISAKSYKVFEYSSGWLNNGGDSVKLINPSGKKIEKYTYADTEKAYAFAKNASGKWLLTSTPTPGKPNKITGQGSSTETGSALSTQSDTLTSTGLDPALDYLGETFQFSDSDNQSSPATREKIAGVSERKSSKDSLATLLMAAGFAFLGTAAAWPLLEKKKLL